METPEPVMHAPTPIDTRPIAQVVDLLRRSRSILFITGAGLSADSGLPTYRGIGGLYENRDPEENVPIACQKMSKKGTSLYHSEVWRVWVKLLPET